MFKILLYWIREKGNELKRRSRCNFVVIKKILELQFMKFLSRAFSAFLLFKMLIKKSLSS